MSLINITNLTFAYDGSYENVFENVSFQIDTQWKLGFVGRNGKGKTTFLNLLMGKYEYTGTISSSVGFEYFPFEVADISKQTQEIAYEIEPMLEIWELQKELSLLDVDEDVLYRSFDTLSFGERTKVMLAVLFLRENRFLLIDEPTNHLDMHARDKLSQYLKSKSGYIVVSHDRDFLDNCVDHILSINNTNIEVQRGNFTSWWANKQNRDQSEIEQNERLKKEIKRMTKAAKRTSSWSDKVEKTKIGAYDKGFIGHKAQKMMKRSKAIEQRAQNAIEEKSTLLKNLDKADDLLIRQAEHHAKTLVELQDVSICYGDTVACENVSFTLNKGDRIALNGKNGSGKSSILKLLLGENISYSGKISLASGLTFSYVSQDTSFLKGSLSDFIGDNKLDESLFKAILRKLGFSREQFDFSMEDFSSGQKKKVLIAKSLCERAHIYVWDEPLNFIDVLSRIQIEQLLEKFKPTMIFVEHDRVFTQKIATKSIDL